MQFLRGCKVSSGSGSGVGFHNCSWNCRGSGSGVRCQLVCRGSSSGSGVGSTAGPGEKEWFRGQIRFRFRGGVPQLVLELERFQGHAALVPSPGEVWGCVVACCGAQHMSLLETKQTLHVALFIAVSPVSLLAFIYLSLLCFFIFFL